MTDIKNEVNEYAEGAIRDADWLARAVEGELGPEVRSHYGLDPVESVDWIDLLNLMALEVYGRATVRPGDTPPIIEQIVVVTGTGGPHVEFEVDMDDNVIGRAIWGSDQSEKFDTMPGLFEALLEVVDS